jgi:peptidyl-prolyl cis-trans isomerase C
LIRQVLAAEAPGEEPSEEECRRVYEASKERFSSPELFQASHILIAPETPDALAWVAAHQRALAVIERIQAGADFVQLARAHSACPTGAEGGAIGQLSLGDLAPELERALLSLTPDSIASAPVRTRHGWHVVRLDRYAPPRLAPFDAVRGAIAASLRSRSAIAASARYVQKLASSACIEGLSLTSVERTDA